MNSQGDDGNWRYRSLLIRHFRDQSGLGFSVTVNQRARGNESARRRQAAGLRKWAVETASPDELFNARGFWQTKPDRWTQNPANALENEEFWRVFDECCAQLPPTVAITFVLRELDQLATEEICATLDISRSAFSVRMHRARAALRECLERHWFLT